MKTKTLTMLGLVLTLAITSQADIGNIQMTFNVVDDFGKAVPDATVGISYIQTKSASATLTARDLTKIQARRGGRMEIVQKITQVIHPHSWRGGTADAHRYSQTDTDGR